MPFTIRYEFSQHFAVPALKAYKWATDYDPGDLALMRWNGKREVTWIDKRTVVLTETTRRNGRRIRKKKLVRLNPERLSWTNTHLTGLTKYSQFLYDIVPEGKNASRLNFTGLQLEYGNKSPKGMVSRLRKEDSGTWKLLAKAMEKDLLKE
ncbi:MAG: hypothetical protein ACYC7D_04280 [Nitrososphaerales archaeon]